MVVGAGGLGDREILRQRLLLPDRQSVDLAKVLVDDVVALQTQHTARLSVAQWLARPRSDGFESPSARVSFAHLVLASAASAAASATTAAAASRRLRRARIDSSEAEEGDEDERTHLEGER